MNSIAWLGIGIGCVAGSFGVQPLAVPLLSTGVVCGVVAEQKRKYELQYAIPLQKMRYATWLDQEEQQIGYVALEADYALQVQHEQMMGVNSSLLLTLDARAQQLEQDVEQQQQQQQQQQSQVQPVEQSELLEADEWGDESATPALLEEDIAGLIASNSMNRDNCGSILIACPKGTGKSRLLRAAIYKLNQISEGTATFSVFNGKEDRDPNGRIVSTFCGLEKDRAAYINAGDARNIEEVSSRLAGITQAMESNYAYPMVQIIDEYNNVLISAQICSAQLKDEQADLPPKERSIVPNYGEKIGLGTSLRITKGRSKLVSDWITSHSPLVQDIRLNTGLQQSLTSVVLGRATMLDALHAALMGSMPVVKNPKLRAQLYEQFLEWERSDRSNDEVICLTNLCGNWRLCLLPQYPENQPEFQQPVIQSSAEFEDELNLWEASSLNDAEIAAVKRLQQ